MQHTKRINFAVNDDTSRNAYRVTPDHEDPVVLMIEGRVFRVVDISASGLSCTGPDLDADMRYRAKLLLRDGDWDVCVHLDCVAIRASVYHFRFVELDTPTQETLHQYVLDRQKQAIRRLRSAQA